MGFLTGRVTFERFRVEGRELKQFGQDQVDKVDEHAIGKISTAAADGVAVGFTAGDHILDLDFRLDKNVINDALHFGLRVDTNKIPGDLLKAYTEMEVAVLAADNPSGYPTRKQRQQAREAAQQRCEEEARTGRFRKMKQYPALWDARTSSLGFGSSSLNPMERFLGLFKEAFGRNLVRLTSGTRAYEWAAEQNLTRSLEDLEPADFTGLDRRYTVAWAGDAFGSRDFLGNEFLLWLWWLLEEQTDTVKLPDGSAATVMLSKTLTLEDPLGDTGKETFTHEAPTHLPEAKRAIQSGKLPRKCGFMVNRHDQQYEFVLQGETFAVGAASLPKPDSPPGRAMLEDRISLFRDLNETLDLLYQVYLQRRLGGSWANELRNIKLWVEKGG